MGMMINRRRVMGGKKLPYDAEIEYLESTGTQYINLGRYLTSASKVEIRTQIMGTGYSNVGLFSAGITTPKAEFYIWGNDIMQLYYGLYSLDFVIALNDIIKISADGETFTVENETSGAKTTASYTFSGQTSQTATLFALHRSASQYIYLGKYRLFRAKIDTLDLIPVVDFNGVGYMYDKVSGKLFGNSGTGNFIVGPRKPEWVDLALPSGKLWADRNIGANSETDAGYYFSWGNIDGHTAGDGYSFDSTNYNSSPGASLTGNISDTDVVHNAACAILGGGATMPSTTDFQELFNANNTTWVWTTVNGVNGYLVTSVRNGRSIFFLAAGYYSGNARLIHRNSDGCYWSASRLFDSNARYLKFGASALYTHLNIVLYNGFTIRAIKSNN